MPQTQPTSVQIVLFDHFGVIGVDPLVQWQLRHKLSPSNIATMNTICERIDRGDLELMPFYSELGHLSNQSSKEVKMELDSLSEYNWELLEYVTKIRKKFQVKIGLLSNAHRSLHRTLWQSGVHPYFDDVITSQEIRQVKPKPDPSLFLHALDRLGGTPESSLFFDDRQVNVDGSVTIGMQGYLFTSNAQCIRDLAKHGLIA